MLCALCDGINVTELVRLVEANWEAMQYCQEDEKPHSPKRWNHYSRYDDLAESAQRGCELCKVVLRGLEGVFVDEGGVTKSYKAELLEMEREGVTRGLDVEIQAETKRGSGNLEVDRDVLYDRLVFHLRGKLDRRILVLSLQKRRDQPIRVEGLEIGHYALDPDLGSETNFEISRTWIQTCSSTHYECPVVEDRPLPTRVIHVGCDTHEPYLLTTYGMKGKYIALSHCWGGTISDDSKLKKATAKTFKRRIAMDRLPPNFRDAILITRGLGFDFLWIDCLCIMQDSIEDWEVESKHMGNVYRDAILTIAAAAASKSTDGILNTFSDYDLSGISISMKLAKDSGPEDHIDLVLRDNNREQLDHLLQNGPLADRGWTFQEEILSARTLYYGRMQIYWQCLHDHASADGLRSRAPFYQRAFRYDRIKDQIHIPQGIKNPRLIKSPYAFVPKDQTPSAVFKRTSAQIIDEYHKQMVVDYCSRHLSYSRDKFPAFSGIVTLVREILQANGYPDSRYIAGIWSSHFRQGLVWYYEDDAIPQIERAPTWSWAATNGKVSFHPSTFASTPFLETPIDPELASYNVVPAGQNPYGEINYASLEIVGSMMVTRGMDRVIVNKDSLACGFIHWDTRITGKGRRKNALFVCRLGKSAMFLFSPQDEKGGLARASENQNKGNMHKASNTRYKIMFIATQARQAHGLLLRQYEVDENIERDDENEFMNQRAKDRDLSGDGADGGNGQSNIKAQPQAENENEEKARRQCDDAETGSSLTKYRRVGYVRLHSKHKNVNRYYDSYRWANLEGWKREKFMLI